MENIGFFGIVFGIIVRLWPVWAALAIVFILSYTNRKRLGLYGQLFDNGVGIVGFMLVLFWLFTAIFANFIAPFDPLRADRGDEERRARLGRAERSHGLSAGRRQSRARRLQPGIYGSRIVLIIAPAAT